MGAETGWAEVSGGRLYFERNGEGAPLVWIHAGIADHRMWKREFAEYAREHTVVRYDVRGLGRSTAAIAPYSDVDDLLAILDKLGIRRATLIGSSNGGRIAIDCAITHPDRVGRLVLVAPGVGGLQPSGDPEEKAAFQEEDHRMGPIQAAYKAGDRKTALDGMRTFWCAAQAGPSLDLVTEMLRDNLDEVFTDASASHSTSLDPAAATCLGSIAAPTLVLLGDRDAPGMRFIVDRVTSGIPGAKRKGIPGADHLVNLSRPHEFDLNVREFLARAE
jgi:pimeloyl-ACP methyl ester carboxylesterase